MPLWVEWIYNHWKQLMLIAGMLIAVVFVLTKKNQLFWKE